MGEPRGRLVEMCRHCCGTNIVHEASCRERGERGGPTLGDLVYDASVASGRLVRTLRAVPVEELARAFCAAYAAAEVDVRDVPVWEKREAGVEAVREALIRAVEGRDKSNKKADDGR